MRNKILLIIVAVLIPFVVISFFNKPKETNFLLEKTEETPNNIEVKVLKNGEVLALGLEDYVIGVVAGEMPASFEMEALKAQAVASRSFALFKKETNNGNYDLTANTNSQVYLSKEEMMDKWGIDFDLYFSKINDAVSATKGEVATYNGEIIEAFYFSMSGGTTEDAQSVFNETLDYLKSTDSVYDNDTLTNYAVTKEFTKSDFKSLLGLSTDDIKIDEVNKDDSNYVSTITISNKTFKGTEIRKLLNLRSANFDIEINEMVEITTYGYGHGVGMSQYGANGYAKNGYTYEEILKHYYTGIEITQIKNV